MRVVVYLRRTSSFPNEISKQLIAAADGFRRHNVKFETRNVGDVVNCDLAVFWGARKSREMQSAKRYIVMERGYVGDRFHWTSMGFDGLNGLAKFYNDNMPKERWDGLFSEYMYEWRGHHKGDYVVIMGQVPNDASLRGMNTHDWCFRIADQLSRKSIPFRIRPHPKDRYTQANLQKLKGPSRQIYLTEPLEDCLDRARWVVCYNSNSSVDSVLRGIPTVILDKGSMAYEMGGRIATEKPPMPDRMQWAHNLAYTQWSMEEIANGDAWDHLKVGLEDVK